jgi:hypothetical protein
VRWKNDGPSQHTTTYDGALALWDSGALDPGDWPNREGETFTTTPNRSGTYAYRCTIVPEMTGELWVVVGVSPSEGSPDTTFTITLAGDSATAELVSDVQMRNDAGEWTDHAVGTTALSVTFQPGTDGPGIYEFRSRTRNSDTNAATHWSPPVSIEVSS